MKNFAIVLIIMAASLNLSAQKIVPLKHDQIVKFVEEHNKYRSEAGVGRISWDSHLANEAKKWALELAKKRKFQHSNMQYGENLYMSSYEPNITEVVSTWAYEKNFYNGEPITPEIAKKAGHYTQIIWGKTTKMGCAIAQDKKGYYYVVCEYSPAGNIIGQKPTDK